MQKFLLLALLWLMPAQAFHYAARVRGLQSLLQPNRVSTAININRSLLTRHAVATKALQASRYTQATTQSISWFSKLRNVWNNFFKQPRATNKNAYTNFAKGSAGFSIGTGISLYALQKQHACHATELPLTWDEIKDPVKLQTKIQYTPDHEKPALAIEIIRYLASYLDSYRWRFALSTAILTYPEIASIIVHFLIQYPTEITQQTKECVPVVEFLITHNKNVAEPIKNCVLKNKSVLKNTAYGPQIISLIKTYSAAQKTNEPNRVIQSK